MHVYVPHHLHGTRGELEEAGVTVSGLLNQAWQEKLEQIRAGKPVPKRRKKSA